MHWTDDLAAREAKRPRAHRNTGGRQLSNRRCRWLFVAVATLALIVATADSAFAVAGFTRAGDMGLARSSFPAASLPDGRVLVVSSNEAEVLDPVTETFSTAGALTTDRGFGPSATLLTNGLVLIAGGQSGDSAQSSAELWEPASETFTPTGSMVTPRAFHTATLLVDGRVLLTGGHQFNHPASGLATAEIYDPATEAFTSTGSMSVARSQHTATLLADGRVLVIGGYDPSGLALLSAEVYDPASAQFTPVDDMAVNRASHTASLLPDGKVLVSGGYAGFPAGATAGAELFDPSSAGFTLAGDMTSPRGDHTATRLPDGRILIAGGFTAVPFLGEPLASAEIYDSETGAFTPTAGMHQPRGRHAAASLPDGGVLVAGGMAECCGSGSTAAEIYSLDVVDTLPPRITVPDEVTTVAFAPEGAPVFYDASAIDNVDDSPELTCEPPSGATFVLGTTVVVCTASDDAGNSASETFEVHVLSPLDIGVSLQRFGDVDGHTGLASVRGSIACNRTASVFISGDLKQVISQRAVVQGTFALDVVCTPPSTSWNATVTPNNGRYKAGKAVANPSAFSCDQFSCDFDQLPETEVRLR